MAPMRHHGSVTSLSWIPAQATAGSQRLAFDAGIAHYDTPPPEVIEDLTALRVLGERAHPEGGKRTSTLEAVTPCRVAAVDAAELDRGALHELSKYHHRTRPDRS
jgi:hypothetical protein